MKAIWKVITILFVCFFISTNSFSQQKKDSASVIKLTLKDESVLKGKVIGQDSSSIKFETIGKIIIDIPKKQIESTELLTGVVVDEKLIKSDPNESRLFFAPTAKPIGAGNGYFSIYELFFPTISFGIGNYFSVSAGISLIPGASDQLFYFAPKITPLKIDDFYLATGIVYIASSGGAADGLGVYYGMATYGNENASFTGGVGWGFSGDRFSDMPILMLGGEVRLSNSVKLITENWIPTMTDEPIISFGLRFFGSKLAGDLGFIRPLESNYDGFPFIPWVGFAYNF